jgi:hypothetical protein
VHGYGRRISQMTRWQGRTCGPGPLLGRLFLARRKKPPLFN